VPQESARFPMLKTRRCTVCGTRLAGKKGHGFVVENGKAVVCADYRRHKRIKRGLNFSYGEEEAETTAEAQED